MELHFWKSISNEVLLLLFFFPATSYAEKELEFNFVLCIINTSG